MGVVVSEPNGWLKCHGLTDLQPNRVRTISVTTPSLATREVYQILRDIALGIRNLQRVSEPSWTEIACGSMTVQADGWILTLRNEAGALDHLISCFSPDGRVYALNTHHHYGTDPVALMSTWEHAQLLRLLGAA